MNWRTFLKPILDQALFRLYQFLDTWYQFKRRTVQTSDRTNVGPYKRRTGTNVGPYNRRTVQTSVLKTSDRKNLGQHKHQTVETSDRTNVGPYKRRTYKHQTIQTSDLTNVRLTNIRPYKRRTLQTSNCTNVGLVQTSDWYKRQTGTNIGLVQTSDRTTTDFIKNYIQIQNFRKCFPEILQFIKITVNLQLNRGRSTIHRPVMLFT